MKDKIFSMVSWHPAGSNYICTPPVTDTDIDYIIYVDDWNGAINWMTEHGFESCGEDKYGGNQFHAFRRDELNYIITYDYIFYIRFVAATELAKRLNHKFKSDRVALFKDILYGEYVNHF